jgi:DNA polymerase (family 10)
MDKREIVHLLEQIAAFLELKGDNVFRIRAYHNAARAIAHFSGDIDKALESGELAQVSGVGAGTLEIVREALQTGRVQTLESLREEIPPGLVEMLKISGLGVAKVQQIHQTLGITTLAELEEAARDGRLAKLPRFGQRTAQKILRGLQFLQEVAEYKLFHHAKAEADRLALAIADLPGVAGVAVAGSVRRSREVIRDLDFVVAVDDRSEELGRRLGTLVGVAEFVGTAPGEFSLRFASDTMADVYACRPNDFGFTLVRATGSQEHVNGLMQRAEALGMSWTDRGLIRDGAPVPAPDEHDVYRALEMQFIPPELRENTGEIDAAIEQRLPHLLSVSDLRGFLHCHSNYSDGTSTVRDWAVAAREGGYEYIGITDHSAAATYAGGLYTEAIGRQHVEIDAVNAEFADVRVLKGVEVDILESGTLDYDDETRARFDFLIASVHNGFGQDRDAMTARILKAMDDPHMGILGHPTGRLLLSRNAYPIDLEAVFDKAAAVGIAIEINADPQRLDLDWRSVREATNRGVTISIGADAHSTGGMGNMSLGVGIGRKGWLTADQVLNARPLEKFLEHVAARRQRG